MSGAVVEASHPSSKLKNSTKSDSLNDIFSPKKNENIQVLHLYDYCLYLPANSRGAFVIHSKKNE